MRVGNGALPRLFLRRAISGLVAVWAVLTLTFGLFALTKDWVLQARVGMLRWGGATTAEVEELRQQYFAARGLDRSVPVRYVDWLGDMLTLDWGRSLATREPVFPMVIDAAGRTLLYVLPAVVLAISLGLAVGLLAALREGSAGARISLGTTYLLFALPNFWLGGLLFSLAAGEYIGRSALLYEHALPIMLVATTLVGGYVSYSRAYAMEYAAADFVKLVRAKGAGQIRVAGHVLRNAAIPVVSMLVTEALGLLVLTVFVVETLFGIDGFGLLLVQSIEQRDVPVVLGGTLLLVVTGVVGNTLQDLSYHLLDPRVDTERR